VLIEEVMPDKSSRAAGQVFEPDRPHKSLPVLGRRLKTKVVVTGLEVTRRPDMPSKSVGGRKPAGRFDSRPPPLLKRPSDQRRSGAGREAAAGKAPIRARTTASTTQVFRCSLGAAPDKSSHRPPEDRTSLQPPSSKERREAAMVRPIGSLFITRQTRGLARRATYGQSGTFADGG
jgi:hypothetical protein